MHEYLRARAKITSHFMHHCFRSSLHDLRRRLILAMASKTACYCCGFALLDRTNPTQISAPELQFIFTQALSDQGFDCDVVAPSRIPKSNGNQIKNDRRDAMMLARLHRAGELTGVYVPQTEDEAIRDLTRARGDAKSDEKRSKQRLLSFLL